MKHVWLGHTILIKDRTWETAVRLEGSDLDDLATADERSMVGQYDVGNQPQTDSIPRS